MFDCRYTKQTGASDMIDSANVRYQRLCIWSGIGFMVLFFIALILAGFIPPPAPTMTGAELLEKFRGNEIGTKLMMPIAIVAAGLAIPWNGLISAHILRIEQETSHCLFLPSRRSVAGF
jgi:hypothetical protein